MRDYIVEVVQSGGDVIVRDLPESVHPGDTITVVVETSSATRGVRVVVEGTIHVEE